MANSEELVQRRGLRNQHHRETNQSNTAFRDSRCFAKLRFRVLLAQSTFSLSNNYNKKTKTKKKTPDMFFFSLLIGKRHNSRAVGMTRKLQLIGSKI